MEAYGKLYNDAKAELKAHGRPGSPEAVYDFLAQYGLFPQDWKNPLGGVKDEYSKMIVINDKSLKAKMNDIIDSLLAK